MTRLLLLSLPFLLGVGCSTPPPPPPASRGEPIDPPGLNTARTVASRGIPSPTAELDTFASLLAKTTPKYGLKELLAAGERGKGPEQLQPGDAVEVRVVDSEMFSGRKEVQGDGTIDLHLVGPVRAANLTTAALAKRVAAALKGKYLKHPSVSISIQARAERSVKVVGRVRAHAEQGQAGLATSTIPLPAYKRMSVYDLVTRVNGLDVDADAKKLVLIRRYERKNRTILRCYHFSFDALLAAYVAGQEAWLRPDDQLVVPRLPDVYVYGAVTNRGRYPLRSALTVAALIVQAGGATPEATESGILILEKETTKPAGLTQVLAPGQVVYVPVAKRVYVVGGGVARSGPITLPPGGLSAVQAISEAGWFTLYGDRDGVEILRSVEGKTRRIPVPVDAILTGQTSTRPYMLRPGDTVFVGEEAW